MTLLLGFENPVVANEMLHAVSAEGAVELASFSVDTAARATLLSIEHDTVEVERAVSTGIDRAGVNVSVLSAWLETEERAFQARAARALHRKQDGWMREIELADGRVVVGLRSLQLGAWDTLAQNCALILHREPLDARTLDAIPAADARAHARGKIAPSRALIGVLAERGLALCHAVRDDLGRPAAVVVGDRSIVGSFASVEGIAKRYEGERAGWALRVGPSGRLP